MESKHEPLQEFEVGEKDLSHGKQPTGKSVLRLKDESVHLNRWQQRTVKWCVEDMKENK